MTWVVVGIGSNLGHRLDNIDRAIRLLTQRGFQNIKRASLYETPALLPEGAPDDWDKPFLNTAICAETEVSPEDALQRLKRIETELGRQHDQRWTPRIIDLDILTWGEERIDSVALQIPHPGLLERYFALRPLVELTPYWRYPQSLGANAAYGGQTAVELLAQTAGYAAAPGRVFAPHTQLVGILNVTPDSFSDGGQYLDPERAVQQAEALIAAGASVIDVGAQSTRPGAECIGAKAEWQRLEPVLSELRTGSAGNVKISIDTYHAEVAQAAIERFDVDWINDVSGGRNRDLLQVVANTGKTLVLMHSLTVPTPATSAQHVLDLGHEPGQAVGRWAEDILRTVETLGVSPECVVLDPGIGFGKNGVQSIQLLKAVAQWRTYGVRVLVGHSRKLFMQCFSTVSPAERDWETVAISGVLLQQKVDFLRVHQVERHRRCLAAAYAVTGPF